MEYYKEILRRKYDIESRGKEAEYLYLGEHDYHALRQETIDRDLLTYTQPQETFCGLTVVRVLEKNHFNVA